MTIYSSRTNYRKIWESHNGPIPRDETGRTYEIHHKDGDKSNNDISNLQCISIQEHYDIHITQGDWSAALAIGSRMKISPEEKSRLASEAVRNQVDAGTHNFLGPDTNQRRVEAGTHNFLGPDTNQRRVEAGTHHFQRRPDGSSLTGDKTALGQNPFSKRTDGSSVGGDNAKLRIEAGTFHFLGPNINQKALEDGVHSSQTKVSCLGCKRVISVSNYFKYHGDKCNQVTGNKHSPTVLPLVSCVYCWRTVDLANFKRWHGTNCKHK